MVQYRGTTIPIPILLTLTGALFSVLVQLKQFYILNLHLDIVDEISIPIDENGVDKTKTRDILSSNPTKAWSNVTTIAWRERMFISGFRNQMMSFTTLVLTSMIEGGHGQIMLESIKMKDLYGSNKPIEFEKIWDVPHFNSFYPRLPRLVNCDEKIHDQFNCTKNDWYWADGFFTDKNGERPEKECSRPYVHMQRFHHAAMKYARYTRGDVTNFQGPDGGRHPAEIIMFQGALRPHPELQKIIDFSMRSLVGRDGDSGKSKSDIIEFIALHARIEPDMQKHNLCQEKKVYNLTDIFNFMETTWPDPPAPHIFMPLNRQLLENEGQINDSDLSKTNWIAVENLRVLNEAKTKGLWNGRARLFEFGSNALKGTPYEYRPSISGSVLNYFISMNAKIFIGTEVSSYSHALMSARFFRNAAENYKYLPSGLHPWTPSGIKQPEGFFC